MKASLKTTTIWNQINWAKVQRKVFKLQKRIFEASKSGQSAKVRRLSKMLMNSYYARLLAVRRVTQDNQGKKTAGVDGKKNIQTSKERLEMVEKIRDDFKPSPLRRKWIPKPGKDEMRPLGIPTIRDRAKQALLKMAMEPEWEAKFEDTSYGFRPGRSCHDAITRIYQTINKGHYHVLDADISNCFNQINHQKLLDKLETSSKVRRIIKGWLKAGCMDENVFEKTEKGTPQGGVISPLLANIALTGMIEKIEKKYPKKNSRVQAVTIRYADDFVVIVKDKNIIEDIQKEITAFLQEIGLELHPEKTRISDTHKGFDFLGFNIRQYPVGKHHAGRTGGLRSQLLTHKTIIKPTKKAVKKHLQSLKEVLKRKRTAPIAAIIKELNPIVRGWCNYYSGVASKETFSKVSNNLFKMLRALTVSRCGKWDKHKYLKEGEVQYQGITHKEKWLFQATEGYTLIKHPWIKIVRHTGIKPGKSPYDGDWTYWTTRKGKEIGIPTRVGKLMQKQKGKCPYCGQYFLSEDIVEIDHIQPKSLGGKDVYKNLQLLHRHCHDKKTSLDGSLNKLRKGMLN